ncbi:MAG: hypothetical protein JXA21_04760 [Anaerolineae bacterium]|nr:hypothetical protein [Anaerolineae bacterium]
MNESNEMQPRKNTVAGIVIALGWILGSVSAVMLVLPVLDMILRIYAAFWGEYNTYGPDYWGAIFIRQILIMAFGALCLALIVGSAEYYSRNYSHPKVWAMMTRILAVEAALATLTIII